MIVAHVDIVRPGHFEQIGNVQIWNLCTQDEHGNHLYRCSLHDEDGNMTHHADNVPHKGGDGWAVLMLKCLEVMLGDDNG